MTSYWLSMHVPYACRHSGACCTAGWPIPVERERVAPLRWLRSDDGWLAPAPHAPPDVAGVLAHDADGRCVFYGAIDRHAGAGKCEIHRKLGHSALPLACQHFPRELLIDPRGVFVTLSHYCPTAASLLFGHAGPVTIVEGPPPLPSGTPEGLDARDVLPPLLRPGLLMDHAAYGAWEAHMVRVLTESSCEPEHALHRLAGHARTLSEWRPADGSLAEVVETLDGQFETAGPAAPEWTRERRFFACALDSTATQSWPAYPEDAEHAWHQKVAHGWHAHRHVVNRFLAAHAFAAWAAYQGNGVVSQISRLRLALAVLRAESIRSCVADGIGLEQEQLLEAIRQTDLLIVHLIDRARLAAQLLE